MTTGTQPGTAGRAFTLIELILVLALLAVLASYAMPSLSRFFRGRVLDSEARQLLSLTHAGQSRAVAGGFPIVLWIDPHERTYGLQEEGTTEGGNLRDADPKAESFVLDGSLQLDPGSATPVAINGQNLPAIRFLPDGTVDEGSPTTLQLTARSGEVLWLIQATNRLSYEIRNSNR